MQTSLSSSPPYPVSNAVYMRCGTRSVQLLCYKKHLSVNLVRHKTAISKQRECANSRKKAPAECVALYKYLKRELSAKITWRFKSRWLRTRWANFIPPFTQPKLKFGACKYLCASTQCDTCVCMCLRLQTYRMVISDTPTSVSVGQVCRSRRRRCEILAASADGARGGGAARQHAAVAHTDIRLHPISVSAFSVTSLRVQAAPAGALPRLDAMVSRQTA